MFRRSTVSAVVVAFTATTLTLTPASAGTATTEFLFTPSGSNATVTGWDTPSTCPATLTIPGTVSDGTTTYTVTAIEQIRFKENRCLMIGGGTTALVLPSSLRTIGERAFMGNTGLRSITINGPLSALPNGVFAGDTALKTITFNANAPGYTTGVNGTFAGIPTGLSGPRVIYADGTLNNGTAWGDTYAGFPTFINPRFTFGTVLVQQVTRKAKRITFFPTYSANTTGTVTITIYTLAKKKGRMVATVHCVATGAVTKVGITGFECVSGTAARKLVRKRATTFYVRANFTQANTQFAAAPVTTRIKVKRAK